MVPVLLDQVVSRRHIPDYTEKVVEEEQVYWVLSVVPVVLFLGGTNPAGIPVD